MRVSIDLPDKVWAQLVDRAEAGGVKVGDILAEKLREIVTPTLERPRRSRAPGVRRQFTATDNREVIRLHAAGVHYAVIAQLFGVNRQTVHMKLTRWGLIEKVEKK